LDIGESNSYRKAQAARTCFASKAPNSFPLTATALKHRHTQSALVTPQSVFLRAVTFFFGNGNSAADTLIKFVNQSRSSHLSPEIKKHAFAPGYGLASVTSPIKFLPSAVRFTKS